MYEEDMNVKRAINNYIHYVDDVDKEIEKQQVIKDALVSKLIASIHRIPEVIPVEFLETAWRFSSIRNDESKKPKRTDSNEDKEKYKSNKYIYEWCCKHISEELGVDDTEYDVVAIGINSYAFSFRSLKDTWEVEIIVPRRVNTDNYTSCGYGKSRVMSIKGCCHSTICDGYELSDLKDGLKNYLNRKDAIVNV